MRVIRLLALPLVAGFAPAANLVHARTPPIPIITTTFAVSPHAASSQPGSLTRPATVVRPCLSIWADGLSFGLGSVAALAARLRGSFDLWKRAEDAADAFDRPDSRPLKNCPRCASP